MSTSLDQKVVLITGAAGGIGRAVADEFARCGLKVIATDRNVSALKDFHYPMSAVAKLDVTKQNDIQELFSLIQQRFGRLDILVNNAGYGQIGPVLDLSPEHLSQQFSVNVFAPLALVQAAAELMIPQQSGLIINVGSVSGILTTPFAGAYCASKASLHALSEAMRLELAPFHIKTMIFQPGAIASDFGSHSSRIVQESIGAKSRYNILIDRIYQRAQSSQKDASSARDCAKAMVEEALKNKPKAVVRFGKKSTIIPLLRRYVPLSLLDRYLSQSFGLQTLNEVKP